MKVQTALRIPSDDTLVKNLVGDILALMAKAVEHGTTYTEAQLRTELANLLYGAVRISRLDEIERIIKNTLDADTDVWSQDDRGTTVSLTDRYKWCYTEPITKGMLCPTSNP